MTHPLLVALLFAGHPVATTVPHPKTHVVEVRATEFKFTAPASVRPGISTFRLTNTGTQLHHLSIVRLPDGKTLEDFVAAVKAEGHPPTWVVEMGGPNAAVPGGSTEATVNLAPGNYVLACYIPSPGEQMPHLMKGMTRALVVRGKPTGGVEPASDVQIHLSDYSFALSRPLTAGTHVIQVTNDAVQPHEVVIVRLAPNRKIAEMGAWVDAGMKGAPPGMPMGGVTPLSTGRSGNFSVRLTPGTYGLICFLPDLRDGKPHSQHGMVQQFDVAMR